MVKWILPMLCAAGVMHALGGLWHGGVMQAFYQSFSTNPNAPVQWIIFLGYLILAALMAYLSPRLVRDGGHPLMNGLKLGLLLGFLWVTPHGVALAGAKGSPLSFFAVDSAWHLVEQGIGGVVLMVVRSRL